MLVPSQRSARLTRYTANARLCRTDVIAPANVAEGAAGERTGSGTPAATAQSSPNAATPSASPIAPNPRWAISHGDTTTAAPTPPRDAPACQAAVATRAGPAGVMSGSRAAYGFMTKEKKKKKPASVASVYTNVACDGASGGIQSRMKQAASAGAPRAMNGRRRPQGLRSRSLQYATGGLLSALTARPLASAMPTSAGDRRGGPLAGGRRVEVDEPQEDRLEQEARAERAGAVQGGT